jgi:hypothetical protein
MMSPVMSTEERLRAATRAAADTVPPGSAPPLRLPPDPAAGPVPGGGSRRRRWLRALTPLAAAAAVAAVVIASLTLTRSVPARPGGGAASPAGSAALSSVPPYYVALTSAARPARAVIRATATGAIVATVRPPKPYGTFIFVSGAADDRTFVLAAQRWWPSTSGSGGPAAQQRDNTTPIAYFRLRFDPAVGAARLTRLERLPGLDSTEVTGIGLSPDGTRLALALRFLTVGRTRPGRNGPGSAGEPGGHGPGIQVYTLATGASRGWVWPGPTPSSGTWVGNDKPGGQPLSWTADGRILAFQFWTESGGVTQVRLLDTTAPGDSLRAARAAVSFVGHGQVKTGPIGNSIITPDGTKIVTVAARTRGGRSGVMEFSVRTGQPVIPPPAGNTTSLGPWNVLWADSSGRTLIAEAQSGPSGAPLTGILRRGRFTPLPGAALQSGNVAW